jgi:hypothetical protein
VISSRFGDEIEAVSVIKGAGDSFTIVGVARVPTGFSDTGPHACKRNARIHITRYLLRTLAVYHNKPKGSSILNLCEYGVDCNQIHSFTGKIARYIYPWRNKCESLS